MTIRIIKTFLTEGKETFPIKNENKLLNYCFLEKYREILEKKHNSIVSFEFADKKAMFFLYKIKK